MKNQSLRQMCSIMFLSLFVTAGAQATLLTAGDFEGLASGTADLNTLNTPVFGEWNVEGTNSVNSAAFGVTPFGSKMMQFDQTGGGNAQTQQYVSGIFSTGSTIDYSVELNASGAGTDGGLFFNAFSGATLVNSTLLTFALDDLTGTWEGLAVSGILAGAADRIEVQVYFNNSGLTGGVKGFMDNAVLDVTPVSVPGPASLVLLLSGLLSLLVARRQS